MKSTLTSIDYSNQVLSTRIRINKLAKLLNYYILRKKIIYKCHYIEPKDYEFQNTPQERPSKFGYCQFHNQNIQRAKHHAETHGHIREEYI